jgi:hypothetical protein
MSLGALVAFALIQIAGISLAIFVARRIPKPGLAYLLGNTIGVLSVLVLIAAFTFLSAFALLYSEPGLPF